MSSMIPYRYRNILNRPEASIFNDDFFRPFFVGNDAGFRVDVKDEGDHYLLEADMPGMKREDIHVDVDDGVLTISADTDERTDEQKKSYVFSERRVGHVQRSFTLNQVKEDGISAEYTDGVLKLTLPKQGEAPKTSHKIEIQ